MAESMTAPQLIDILRSNPGACAMLGLSVRTTIDERDVVWTRRGTRILFASTSDGEDLDGARFRMTGAAVEKCDELGIEIVHAADGFKTIERHVFKPTMFGGGSGIKIGKKHPTRLHAAIAALEIHAKGATIAQ